MLKCFDSFKWCFNRLIPAKTPHSGVNVSPEWQPYLQTFSLKGLSALSFARNDLIYGQSAPQKNCRSCADSTYDGRPAGCACLRATSCPVVSPHFTICFTTGIRLFPTRVKLYSTFGGITGYCLRSIKPRLCNSFNSRLRTRGVTGAPRPATIADLRSSPYRREPSFSSQRILILYLPPAASMNAFSGQHFTWVFGMFISSPALTCSLCPKRGSNSRHAYSIHFDRT